MSSGDERSLYITGFILAIVLLLLAILVQGWLSITFYALCASLIAIMAINMLLKSKPAYSLILQATVMFVLLLSGMFIIYSSPVRALTAAISVSLILTVFFIVISLPNIERFQKASSRQRGIVFLAISLMVVAIGIFFSLESAIVYVSIIFFGLSLFFLSLGIFVEKGKQVWNLIGQLMIALMFLSVMLATNNWLFRALCVLTATISMLIVAYRTYRLFKNNK